MNVIAGLVALVALPIALAAKAKQRRKRFLLYQQVAARYPEARVVDGGFWKPHQLVVTHQGVAITVSMWDGKNGSGTAWEAPATTAAFKVYPHGLSSSVGKSLFGTQDIEVGDEEFDRIFMVKGDDPPLVRRAWSGDACALMRSRFATSRIVSRGDEIRLDERRLVDSPDELADGIELIGKLAARDLYGVSALRRLDGASYYRETPPYVIVRGAADIKIGPVTTAAGTVTRAGCLADTDSADPDPDKLAAIGATFARDGQRLQITWPGIETSAARLTGAIDLLRELTRAPPVGVFR